jgi:hypothetical protein
MTDLKSVLSEAVGAAFAAGGMAKEAGRVTVSDRPDLADFQSNGALAAGQTLTGTGINVTTSIVSQLTGTIGGVGGVSEAAAHIRDDGIGKTTRADWDPRVAFGVGSGVGIGSIAIIKSQKGDSSVSHGCVAAAAA